MFVEIRDEFAFMEFEKCRFAEGLRNLKKVLTDKREYGILIKVAEDSRCVSVS